MPFFKDNGFVSLHTFITFVSQRGNELLKAMEQTSYNIEAGVPDLVDHSQKLLGLYKPELDFGFLSISLPVFSVIFNSSPWKQNLISFVYVRPHLMEIFSEWKNLKVNQKYVDYNRSPCYLTSWKLCGSVEAVIESAWHCQIANPAKLWILHAD